MAGKTVKGKKVMNEGESNVTALTVVEETTTPAEENDKGLLTAKEKTLFVELEKTIGDNLMGFYAVGRALAEIRDKDLYKETPHKTFEAYCQERWNMGRNYANKQIAASSIVDKMGTNVTKPKNEAQVRPLLWIKVKNDEEMQDKLRLKAWESAIKKAGTATLTEGIVIKSVLEIIPKKIKEGASNDIRMKVKDFQTEFSKVLTVHKKNLASDMDIKPIEKILEDALKKITDLIENAAIIKTTQSPAPAEPQQKSAAAS